MAREDYEQIKQKFEKFVNTWKTRDATVLENIVHPEIKCYMSIAKAYPDGSQHSKVGIQDFVRDFPQTDVLHINICNRQTINSDSNVAVTAPNAPYLKIRK